MGDFNIVTKDLVVPHLKRADTGSLPFHSFQIGDPLAGMLGGFHNLVKLGRVPRTDDT